MAYPVEWPLPGPTVSSGGLPRRWAVVVVAAAVLAVLAGGAVALNQRGVAAQWRERARSEASRADRATTDLTDAQSRNSDLETRLAGAAHDSAAKSDDLAVYSVLQQSADDALRKLQACSAGIDGTTCLQGIRDARSVLSVVADDSK